jgi:hypothetical protein
MLGGYHKEGKVLNQVFNQLRTNMKNLTRWQDLIKWYPNQ